MINLRILFIVLYYFIRIILQKYLVIKIKKIETYYNLYKITKVINTYSKKYIRNEQRTGDSY
jgi:hypothetical protein